MQHFVAEIKREVQHFVEKQFSFTHLMIQTISLKLVLTQFGWIDNLDILDYDFVSVRVRVYVKLFYEKN